MPVGYVEAKFPISQRYAGNSEFVLGYNTLKGTIRYVDSNVSGGVAGNGLSWAGAYLTINAAVVGSSADDTILVAPNHTETITAAAGISVNKAGLSIIGLGRGSRKPTVTFGTSTATDINVSAANVLIKNLRLVNGIDSLVNFLDLDEDWFFGEDLDFVTSSALEAVGFINLATTKDNFYFRGLTALQPSDPTGSDGAVDTGFLFMIDSENIVVEDSSFYGNFETAIFHNRTTACKNFWVRNCQGIQSLSGAEPFQLVSGANGGCYGGGFNTPAEAAATEATLVGTLGNDFFISPTTGFGNDGGAGGQGGIIVATAS